MAKRKSLYGVHPGIAMVQKWIAGEKDAGGAVATAMRLFEDVSLS